MKIQDPSGQTWDVSRRWMPWRPRKRHFDTGDAFPATADVNDLWALVVIVVVLLLLPVILLITVFVAEVLLVLLLVPILVLIRAGLTRRWPIEVVHGGRVVHVEVVKGWDASSRRLEQLRAEVRRGAAPGEADHGASPI